MGRYTDIDRVRAGVTEGAISDTSRPNSDQVDDWIDEDEDTADVALAAGGATLPLPAGASAIKALRGLVTRHVQYRWHCTQGVTEDPKHTPFWKGWQKEWEDALQQMRDRKWLAGTTAATTTAGTNLPWSPTMNAPSTTDPSVNAGMSRLLDLE